MVNPNDGKLSQGGMFTISEEDALSITVPSPPKLICEKDIMSKTSTLKVFPGE